MIKDKVVIITGGSSGIGEATARLLASQGARVVLGARRADWLQRIADGIRLDGGEAVGQETDVTRPEDNERLVRLAMDEFGRISSRRLAVETVP